ncbi:MAG: hypothetical protein RIS35_2087 [Pseudomonadota bacterium]
MLEKLIRDRIPAIARAEGRELPVRSAGGEELARLLGLKLVEETQEVLDALSGGSPSGLLDELADLQTVIESIAIRHGFAREDIDRRVAEKRAERGGFEDGLVLRQTAVRFPRLHAGGSRSLLDAMRRELEACATARIAVAFVMGSGVDLIEGPLLAALLRGAEVRLLTTDYLDVTEPEALDRVCRWRGRIDVRVYSHPRRSFHPKAYLFERADGSGRAFIGSANLSRTGLLEGVEWTWTVLDVDAGQPMHELNARFDELFACDEAKPLTPDWIEAYRARRKARSVVEPSVTYGTPAIEPREVQRLAMQELARLRNDGEKRALVVAATGLGKTFLAALDAGEFDKVLFIAHREELLRQAAQTFERVYPGRTRGFVREGRADYDRDCVFASIQTLSRPEHLSRADLARFDYVVIDEFHHAAADSYTLVLERLSPRFLLGLTATPFRGDNRDLLALCDGNLAYQVGLFEAIAFGWLVPFRYHGVADVVDYTDDLLTSSRTYDVGKLTLRFNTEARAEVVLQRFAEHRSRAALGFCVSIEHADFMAERFQRAGVPAAAVHSGPTSLDRADALSRLADGTLRVLFTVDLFNEGIDIPAVDLVMFLRPTESMTVFLQQLGRGMRLHDGKSFLTVLDFIGNYRNAHYKLPLLSGQDLVRNADPAKALDALLRWQRSGARPDAIPDGVEIRFDDIVLADLRVALGKASPLKQLVLADLADHSAQLGRPPTLVEWQRFGRYSLATARKALAVDRWNRVLEASGLLAPEDATVERLAGDFLKEIESSRMTKSFKMVVLLAICDGRAMRRSLPVDELIAFFRRFFSEDRHREDVIGTPVEDVAVVPRAVWRRYLIDNPINARIGGNTKVVSPYFAWSETADELRYIGPVPEDPMLAARFAVAVHDRVRAMLEAYWRRPGPGRFVYPVIPTGSGGDRSQASSARAVCVMFGNDRAGLPTGWHLVAVNGRHLYGKFVKVAMNVLKAQPSEDQAVPNLLTEELTRLFDGRLPPRPRVRLVRDTGVNVWCIERA